MCLLSSVSFFCLSASSTHDLVSHACFCFNLLFIYASFLVLSVWSPCVCLSVCVCRLPLVLSHAAHHSNIGQPPLIISLSLPLFHFVAGVPRLSSLSLRRSLSLSARTHHRRCVRSSVPSFSACFVFFFCWSILFALSLLSAAVRPPCFVCAGVTRCVCPCVCSCFTVCHCVFVCVCECVCVVHFSFSFAPSVCPFISLLCLSMFVRVSCDSCQPSSIIGVCFV